MKRTLFTQLPQAYNKEEAEAALRSAFEDVDVRLAEIDRRLPAPKVNRQQASTSPREAAFRNRAGEELIEMQLVPDPYRDRWITDTVSSVDYAGPGRIWRVRSSSFFRMNSAPQKARYRIVAKGLEFGVMSVRMLDTLRDRTLASNPTRWEISYGILILNVPNVLGRMPTRMTVDYGAFPLASGEALVTATTPSWSTNTRAFFDTQASAQWGSSNNQLLTEMTGKGAPASGWMLPTTVTSDYPAQVEGVVPTLITAEDEHVAYLQLNGLESANLAHLAGRPRGLPGLVPAGAEANGLAVAGFTAISSATQSVSRTTATAVGTDRVIEGVPFQRADVNASIYRGDTFALALVLDPPRILEGYDWMGAAGALGAPTDDMGPAMWHTAGLTVDPSSTRTAALDIILE